MKRSYDENRWSCYWVYYSVGDFGTYYFGTILAGLELDDARSIWVAALDLGSDVGVTFLGRCAVQDDDIEFEVMLSRLDKLETEIANGITREEDMDYVRKNIAEYYTPGEFYEIWDRLVARRDARTQLAANEEILEEVLRRDLP